MSISFGIISTIWLLYFSKKSKMIKSVSGILIIPTSVLLASIPGSMLWAYFDMSAGRFHGLIGSVIYMLKWIPIGLKFSLPIFALSFPINVITTLIGLKILFSTKVQRTLLKNN